MHDNSLPVGDRDDYEDSHERYLQPFLSHDIKEAVDVAKENCMHNVIEVPSPFAVWSVADKNGWHSPSCSLEADLLLIHSEISEACEAMRIGNLTGEHGVGEELADAVIRIFHTAQKNNINIVDEIFEKHHKNMSRSYRHGNKLF